MIGAELARAAWLISGGMDARPPPGAAMAGWRARAANATLDPKKNPTGGTAGVAGTTLSSRVARWEAGVARSLGNLATTSAGPVVSRNCVLPSVPRARFAGLLGRDHPGRDLFGAAAVICAGRGDPARRGTDGTPLCQVNVQAPIGRGVVGIALTLELSKSLPIPDTKPARNGNVWDFPCALSPMTQ